MLKVKRCFCAGFVAFSLSGLGFSASFASQVMDATHTSVQLPDYPKRIVTLAPSLGELAADILGQEIHRIVGVSEYTDYPPKLRWLPSIGPYHQFNFEKVLSLRPDLVFATLDGNSKEQVKHLRDLGISVVVVETGDFSEIAHSMQLIAKSLGNLKLGEEMALNLTKRLQGFREKAKSHPPLKVLMQIGDSPLVVVGGHSFLSSALKTVGARNVYEDAQAHYPRPSLEDVFQKDPDVIIIVALGDDIAPFQAITQKWSQFPLLKAVKNRRVHLIKSDVLLRPTLRIIEGLSLLEKTVYGKK